MSDFGHEQITGTVVCPTLPNGKRFCIRSLADAEHFLRELVGNGSFISLMSDDGRSCVVIDKRQDGMAWVSFGPASRFADIMLTGDDAVCAVYHARKIINQRFFRKGED